MGLLVTGVWETTSSTVELTMFVWYIKHFTSLPETNSSHLKMDGRKTSFLLGWPIFRGYLSFRECIFRNFSLSNWSLREISRRLDTIWRFPKMVVPQNGWFIMDNFINMHDIGGKTHHFRKHPYTLDPPAIFETFLEVHHLKSWFHSFQAFPGYTLGCNPS